MNDFLAKLGPNWNYGLGLSPYSFASKEKEFDADKNFAFTSRTYLKNSNNNFDDGTNYIKKMLIDTSLPVNTANIINTYDTMLSDEFEALKNVRSLISSYGQFMDNKKIKKILDDKKLVGTLSKDTISGLLSNMYIQSRGKELSNNKKLLQEIEKENPEINLRKLTQMLRIIESRYRQLSLDYDAPEALEFED